jgi:hypothetical protein
VGVGQISGSLDRAACPDRDRVLNDILVRDGRPHPPATVEEFDDAAGLTEAAE